MIVTKQRKSLQPSTTYKHDSIRQSIQPSSLIMDYNNDRQHLKYNYGTRQRNSLSTTSPISKNNEQRDRSYVKKSDKKYDYSIDLNSSYEKSFDDRIQSNKATMIIDAYEKRRSSQSKPTSIVNNRCENVHARQSLNQMNIANFTATPHNRSQNEFPKQRRPSLDYSQNVSSSKQASSITKNKQNIMKIEQTYQQFNKSPPVYNNFTSIKFKEDNFSITDKFKQFSTMNKVGQIDNTKNRVNRYDTKYAKMRNNKRCEIIADDPIKQNEKAKIMENTQNRYLRSNQREIRANQQQAEPLQLNYDTIRKSSDQQNNKIMQKINRITKLNEEINARLQKMLAKNNNA